MVAKPKRLPFYNRPKKQVKFEGGIDALKGHIYDCTDSHQEDLYTKMTKEIAGYVATSLKNGNDVMIAIETLTVPMMKLPNNLPAMHQLPRKGTGRRDQQEIDDPGGKDEDPVFHSMGTSIRCSEAHDSSA